MRATYTDDGDLLDAIVFGHDGVDEEYGLEGVMTVKSTRASILSTMRC